MLCLWPALSMAADGKALRAFASIEPIQFVVERVGGSRVGVEVLVGAGQRPETYEPTPRQIAALARSDVFFGVGMPLEAAWRRQIRETTASEITWVDLSADLPGHGGPEAPERHAPHAAGDSGHRHGLDPHVWLSPANARGMASTIADVLGRLDPEHAARFEANAQRLRSELQALDREIAGILAGSGVDAFLVYHPAWGHFARAYGLTQISIESEGKEPGSRGLVKVIRKAQAAGIRTVFVDPRHSRRLAETVAEAIDGRVEVLDPLSYDYFDSLRRAARAIAASRS